MMLIDNNPWFIKYNQIDKPSLFRLFCFHYGGGSASVFYGWEKMLPEGVELIAIQLPGRDTRFSEQPIGSLQILTEQLSKEIVPYLDKPYAVFGHSIGGLIGFELVRAIRELSLRLPNCIIVSAAGAPQLPLTRNLISKLPDKEFIESLKIYNGAPDFLVNNEEMRAVFIPILRADLTILETYTYLPQLPLDCPIVAIGGIEDPIVLPKDIAAWYSQAKHSFKMHLFEGGHFFIKEYKNEVLSYIANLLQIELANILCYY